MLSIFYQCCPVLAALLKAAVSGEWLGVVFLLADTQGSAARDFISAISICSPCRDNRFSKRLRKKARRHREGGYKKRLVATVVS